MGTTSARRIRTVVALNLGVLLVFVSIPLPWARIAGETYRGPAFADLLLGLPDIPVLGSHLVAVALLWYSLPLLALAAWLTQFRRWPPAVDRLSMALAVVLAGAVGLLMVWFAIRGVGFPSVGGVVASVGTATVLVAAVVGAGQPQSAAPGA